MKYFNFLFIGLFLWGEILFSTSSKTDEIPNTLSSIYNIDEAHTQIAFKVKHLGISTITGQFKKHSGSFNFNPKTGELKDLNVDITVSSINTNEPKRDEHLKSSDFFDATKFPKITFSANSAMIKEKQSINLDATLFMHGIKKNITLKVTHNGSVTDPWGNERIGFSANTTIQRKDFGLIWNKTFDKGGVMISDEIDISIEGEAILKKKN